MWIFTYLENLIFWGYTHIEALHFSRCQEQEVWEFDEDSICRNDDDGIISHTASYNVSCKKCGIKQTMRRVTMIEDQDEAREYLRHVKRYD